MANLVEKFRDERIKSIESILKSVKFIRRLYTATEYKNYDLDQLNGLRFRRERRNLLRHLDEFKSLFAEYSSILPLLKDNGAEERQTYVTVLHSALDVIDAVPHQLKKFRYVPIVENVELQFVEEVGPPVENVVREVSEVVCRAVSRPTFKIVKHLVKESVIPQFAKAPVIVPKSIAKVVSVSKIVLPSVVTSSPVTHGCTEIENANRNVHVVQATLGSFPIIDSNIDLEFMLQNNGTLKLNNSNPMKDFESNVCLKFYRFYCKNFLRCFWTFYLFSDFNLYAVFHFMFRQMCDSNLLFNCFICIFCSLLWLSRISFLTVGSVTAAQAVDFMFCY